MYTMFKHLPIRTMATTQAPALLIAFVIAELFYKWKSFALECLGFLVTWFVLDFVISTIRDFVVRQQSPEQGRDRP